MIEIRCKHGNYMTLAENGVIAVRFVPNSYTDRIGICFCSTDINEKYLMGVMNNAGAR